jgi:hypothetical protein
MGVMSGLTASVPKTEFGAAFESQVPTKAWFVSSTHWKNDNLHSGPETHLGLIVRPERRM